MSRHHKKKCKQRLHGTPADTLFYQGIFCSQAHALNYTGDRKIKATTGETMWSVGRNKLQPLNVILNLFIGEEIADVNLNGFEKFSLTTPIKLVGAGITWAVNNYYQGYRFIKPKDSKGSVAFHVPIFTKISIGQETDINSHRRKYIAWKKNKNRSKRLICYGVSRGSATTFCAVAIEKYPEVGLVILEGAIDSLDRVFKESIKKFVKSEKVSNVLGSVVNNGLSFFTKLGLLAYRADGISPLKCVEEFPEGVPVVFITSKADKIVPPENTINIASALAKRGKNDVYLLILEKASHPEYMYSDVDRDRYETFIHAIYKKYGFLHDEELARKGEKMVKSKMLCEYKPVTAKKFA